MSSNLSDRLEARLSYESEVAEKPVLVTSLNGLMKGSGYVFVLVQKDGEKSHSITCKPDRMKRYLDSLYDRLKLEMSHILVQPALGYNPRNDLHLVEGAD